MNGKIAVIALLLFSPFSQYGFGQQWEALGNGVSGPVRSMYADYENDHLYISGDFGWVMTETDTSTVTSMTIWDGNDWLAMPEAAVTCFSYLCSPVSLVLGYNDTMLFSGLFSDGQFVKMLSNGEWQNFGEPNDFATLRLVDDVLFATGPFTQIGGQSISNRLASYDGTNWHQFGGELEGFTSITSFSQIIKYQNNYYVGGNFHNPDGRNNIMYWDGHNWQSLGQGLLGSISWVNSMTVYNDLLYVGGHFTQDNGNVGNFIMAWDGEEWHDVFPQINYISGAGGMVIYEDVMYIAGLYFTEDPCCLYTMGTYDGTQFCTFGGHTVVPETPNSFPHQIAIMHDKVYVRVGITFFGESVNFVARIDIDAPSDYCVDIDSPATTTETIVHDSNISVNPNPTSSLLTLAGATLQPGTHMTVYSLTGQQVYARQLQQAHEQLTLDARQFGPAGMYLLRIQTPGQTAVVKKVVVQE